MNNMSTKNRFHCYWFLLNSHKTIFKPEHVFLVYFDVL